MNFRLSTAALIVVAAAVGSQGQTPPAAGDPGEPRIRSYDCPLDDLLDLAKMTGTTPDAFDARFNPDGETRRRDGRPPLYRWLTAARDRAFFRRRPFSNVELNLTLCGGELKVEEATVDFLGGKLNGITFSLANRGDSGEIDPAEFRKTAARAAKEVGARLGGASYARRANPAQGLLVDRLLWNTPKGLAVLEQNPEAATGKPEFLRLRLAPRDTKGLYAAAMQDRSSALKLSELPAFVRKSPTGDVMISGLPMVDQGPKGYCVVASVQRLFEFFGVPCDQHQLAQVAGSTVEKGTSDEGMVGSLEKIDHRFRMNFRVLLRRLLQGGFLDMRTNKPADQGDFLKLVRRHVDQGLPLLWSVMLGVRPEEPANAAQAGGHHMRLIIGYNDKTRRILFTDSWGAGHERKSIDYTDAEAITFGLFLMQPTSR